MKIECNSTKPDPICVWFGTGTNVGSTILSIGAGGSEASNMLRWQK